MQTIADMWDIPGITRSFVQKGFDAALKLNEDAVEAGTRASSIRGTIKVWAQPRLNPGSTQAQPGLNPIPSTSTRVQVVPNPIHGGVTALCLLSALETQDIPTYD